MRRAPMAEATDVDGGLDRVFAAHFMDSYSEHILFDNCLLSLCGRNSLARVGSQLKLVK